jgi:ring-1,2-phenylacetyl-CoA epoxidase subunit PaaC
MFAADALEHALIEQGVAIDPESLRPGWDETVERVLNEATLARPAGAWMQLGGRAGRHSEHLGHLLAVMQVLPRTYPGARW